MTDPARRRNRSCPPGLGWVVCWASGCYVGVGGSGDDGADTDAPASMSDGDDAADASGGSTGEPGDVPPDDMLVAKSGMRLLTADEYDNTLRDLLLDTTRDAATKIADDVRTPFDNDVSAQVSSQALVEGLEFLATAAAERLVADPDRRATIVGCVPASPTDEDCMRAFAERFGKQALRRSVSAEEVDLWLLGENGDDGALAHAATENDFFVGVATIVRLLLQHPEFVHRVEIGEPVPDDPTLFRLNDHEMATRLSYLVWGSTPDGWMLEAADRGELGTAEEVGEAAEYLLADPRAVDRFDRFHAMWFGYEQMPFAGELAESMRAETRALLERVVFEENRAWHDLFRTTETFVTPELATHYGLQRPPNGPAWVDYGASGRQGLLSHGAFLSIGWKFGDTSPVQRGFAVRTNLLCQAIPDPPPNVDADDPPSDGICKADRYAAHSEGGCAACHGLMDPIGFGLEQYDGYGAVRAFEPDVPATPEDESQCAIAGDGTLAGVGDFNGPAELSNLLLEARLLDECVTRQLYRFTMGRAELDDVDQAIVADVVERLGTEEFTFRDLVLAIVAAPEFGYRREEGT